MRSLRAARRSPFDPPEAAQGCEAIGNYRSRQLAAACRYADVHALGNRAVPGRWRSDRLLHGAKHLGAPLVAVQGASGGGCWPCVVVPHLDSGCGAVPGGPCLPSGGSSPRTNPLSPAARGVWPMPFPRPSGRGAACASWPAQRLPEEHRVSGASAALNRAAPQAALRLASSWGCKGASPEPRAHGHSPLVLRPTWRTVQRGSCERISRPPWTFATLASGA